jgi:peptide/nickel transport system permease protein
VAASPQADRTRGDEPEVGYLTQGQLAWRRFRTSRLGLCGGILVVLLYLSALFADFLSPYRCNTTLRPARPCAAADAAHPFDAEGFHAPFVYDLC